MAKLRWDAFINKHTKGICVLTRKPTLAKGQKRKKINSKGVEISTLYKLLSDYLEKHLQGDWAIRTEGSLFHIILHDQGGT